MMITVNMNPSARAKVRRRQLSGLDLHAERFVDGLAVIGTMLKYLAVAIMVALGVCVVIIAGYGVFLLVRTIGPWGVAIPGAVLLVYLIGFFTEKFRK